MSWNISQIGQIFALAESGLLHAGQVKDAARLDALRPARAAWLEMGSRVCAYAGTLLLASAVIFFFAYNWADLPRFAKIGLALAGVVVAVAAAGFSRPFATGWRAALFGASLCTGALLALIGQTYQTGADIWELFAAWALLITPFVLLARSSASWLLWLVVANMALIRMLNQNFGFILWYYNTNELSLFIVAGFNLVLLAALELWSARLLLRPSRHLHRVTALALIWPLTFAGCVAWDDADYALLSFGFFALAAVMLWFYRQIRFDLAMLAIAGFALIIVTTTGLGHWLFVEVTIFSLKNDTALSLILLALYLILTTGALAVWLKRLHRSASTPAQGKNA
ncbi:hypothetical protein FACS1894154_05100 [Betaproteobacteria bacterium]|nr:hypothetical protein FACS1894154_05100 [Betaproteobacteria bacterium]GHU22682.1 hypothetical protein FACS189488_03700 [Betaproteobacteria bacterium]